MLTLRHTFRKTSLEFIFLIEHQLKCKDEHVPKIALLFIEKAAFFVLQQRYLLLKIRNEKQITVIKHALIMQNTFKTLIT